MRFRWKETFCGCSVVLAPSVVKAIFSSWIFFCTFSKTGEGWLFGSESVSWPCVYLLSLTHSLEPCSYKNVLKSGRLIFFPTLFFLFKLFRLSTLFCMSIYILFFNVYLFFWLCWVFIAKQAFLHVSGGYSPAAVRELLIGEAFLLQSTRSRVQAQVAGAHGVSCPMAHRIFRVRNWTCLLHW